MYVSMCFCHGDGGARRGRPKVVSSPNVPSLATILIVESFSPIYVNSNSNFPNEMVPQVCFPENEHLLIPEEQMHCFPVDDDEGMFLEYVLTSEVNKVRYAKIEKDDVILVMDFLQLAVSHMILGANPPINIIRWFVCLIYKAYKVILARKGVFIVRFTNVQDKQAIVQRGMFFFDSKPFRVQAWNPERSINTEAMLFLIIRVQFPDLDIKYWSSIV
ncbi:hypothetical protein Cgig2_004414 [Carnegiea gigantea]|uniref:DUF4283 domain-containing protein n=1 Tax=Carnegiea gigantea TaxID=171969 RepID=A0A9Q1GGB5_9CARY|nr:hypothetical protein Cgig2_004414 [Carnegiea gigantea]